MTITSADTHDEEFSFVGQAGHEDAVLYESAVATAFGIGQLSEEGQPASRNPSGLLRDQLIGLAPS